MVSTRGVFGVPLRYAGNDPRSQRRKPSEHLNSVVWLGIPSMHHCWKTLLGDQEGIISSNAALASVSIGDYATNLPISRNGTSDSPRLWLVALSFMDSIVVAQYARDRTRSPPPVVGHPRQTGRSTTSRHLGLRCILLHCYARKFRPTGDSGCSGVA